jgi:hypothetical protein
MKNKISSEKRETVNEHRCVFFSREENSGKSWKIINYINCLLKRYQDSINISHNIESGARFSWFPFRSEDKIGSGNDVD